MRQVQVRQRSGKCVNFLQDFPWTSFAGIAEKPWNEVSARPMSTWLTDSQNQQDRDRLRMMGNIVVPEMARVGFEVLLRMVSNSDKL